MAGATKRTSVLLGAAAVVFIIIIVILCIVPREGSPVDDSTKGSQKSKEVMDVDTYTSTAPTTVTSTPMTTKYSSDTSTHHPFFDDTTLSTTDDSLSSDTTLDDSHSSGTTLLTTDDSLSSDTTLDDSHSDTTLSTTDDSLSSDTTLDDSFFSDTTLSTTDDSLSSDTTLDDSFFSDTTLSTTDDSLSSDTTLDDSFSRDTTFSTTDDSLSNDTTLDDSLFSDTTFSTTDDSLSNDTTFDDSLSSDTTLTTTDDNLSATTSQSTILSTTHEATTTTLPTSTSPELTTTPQATTIETTEKEPTPAPPTTTTSPQCSTHETCNTPACKTVAANMLAMMDHGEGVDPCQDFYQYACGGLMQNPFLNARNHRVIAERLIEDQLETTDHDDTPMGKMRIFYDSCLNAVDQNTTEGWKQSVRNLFGEQQFYLLPKPDVTPLDLIDTLAHMMLHNFVPFFDVSLDVDANKREAFSVALHPVVPGSPFSEDLARKVCLEAHHRKLENLENTNSYDVGEEYKTFTDCVLTGNGLETRLERMEEAVRRFGVLDHLGDSAMSNQVLQTTKSIAKRFLQDLATKLPSVPLLKQHLRDKTYNAMILEDLNYRVINWTMLMQQLIPSADVSIMKVQLYLKDNIAEILDVVNRYNIDDPAGLNNVLLMLWSEKLYTDFVKPLGSNVGEHKYCLHAANTLMQDAASRLYMDTLSDDEINARRTQITNIGSSIKRAGKRTLERNKKENKEAQEKLEYMLNNVITADISEVEDASTFSTEELNITTSDFFDNCIQLLRNQRRLMYDMYHEITDEKSLMFMQPYNPSGVHVYAMNSIMIPYAAQEDSETFENVPAYLSYAGIGHMISHLVMHAYDSSGIHYSGKGYEQVVDDDYYMNQRKGLQEQYQAEQSYENPGNVAANITMSALALNELLADSGAARLAWEAYLMRNEPDPTNAPLVAETYESESSRRRRSLLNMTSRTKRAVTVPSLASDEKRLPWLDLSPVQLYFLHWSQHYCSATGGMSLLELMENLQPPARMRVNLVVQNEPLFSNAFECTPKIEQTPFLLD